MNYLKKKWALKCVQLRFKRLIFLQIFQGKGPSANITFTVVFLNIVAIYISQLFVFLHKVKL